MTGLSVEGVRSPYVFDVQHRPVSRRLTSNDYRLSIDVPTRSTVETNRPSVITNFVGTGNVDLPPLEFSVVMAAARTEAVAVMRICDQPINGEPNHIAVFGVLRPKKTAGSSW